MYCEGGFRKGEDGCEVCECHDEEELGCCFSHQLWSGGIVAAHELHEDVHMQGSDRVPKSKCVNDEDDRLMGGARYQFELSEDNCETFISQRRSRGDFDYCRQYCEEDSCKDECASMHPCSDMGQ